jgi:hydrogenase expression/formation protein HypC
MCLAIPGKVVELQTADDRINRPGKVSFGGIIREVNFCFLPEVEVDDYVLVHVGVALSKVDEEEALETLRYLREMGELDELNPEPDGFGE